MTDTKNILTLSGDHGTLASIDITRTPGGFGSDYAGGELKSNGGNLWLEIDGVDLGSLWITYDEDGTPKLTLGQYDPETQDWEERSTITPLPADLAPPAPE